MRSLGGPRAKIAESRAIELARLIHADTSPLALKPHNEGVIVALCRASIAGAEASVASSTALKDDLAWTRWETYCLSMNTPAFRSDIRANAGIDYVGAQRESLLLVGFMIHCAATISSYGGKGACKPQTALDMVLAIKRIHKRLGVPIDVLPSVRSTFRGLVRQYVEKNGPDAIMPKRKEPLSNAIIAKILELPNGTAMGRKVLNWDSPFFTVFKAILCAGFSSGMRKAEMTLAAGEDFDATHLSRASVTWIIKGCPVASPTVAQLKALVTGDFCGIKPAGAKNDPFALHFGWKPIWLPVADAPTNAARAIAAMLLAVPIPNSMAAAVPLFSIDSNGGAFRQSVADSTLAMLLKAAMPGEDVTRWSMHSLRIGCACALMVAGASTDQIMALCRWRSPGSVAIYARMGPKDYGNWVLKAQAATVDATTSRNLPSFDYDDLVTILNDGAALNWEDPI